MIKKIVLALVAICVLISCESSQNYSVQLENQRKQIREYIERNGISLIETYPADTGDIDYPLELVFDPDPNSATNQRRSNTNSIGWQSAIRLMQRSDAIAEFIVPSPIGTLTAFNNVKAYRYKFTFKIQPK